MKTQAKSYQNVVLHLPRPLAHLVLQALLGERRAISDEISLRPFPDKQKKTLQIRLNRYESLIEYVKDKILEANTPNEVDALIQKIAEW